MVYIALGCAWDAPTCHHTHDVSEHEPQGVVGVSFRLALLAERLTKPLPPSCQELMCRGADLMEVLRLLVLLNECHQGLSKKHLDVLRAELLHTYGHEHLVTLASLEGAGERMHYRRNGASQGGAGLLFWHTTITAPPLEMWRASCVDCNLRSLDMS